MLKGIVLHKSTKLQLESIIMNDSLHAFGLVGVQGSGKTYLAKHLAQELLKIDNLEGYPYFLMVNCEVDSGIETSRLIKKFMDLKVPGDKKINRCIVLKSVENLSLEAQNALLKSIEEPPVGTVIIATCNSLSMLKPTVISRMQWVNVLPLDKETLAENFGQNLDNKMVESAYALSEGNLETFLQLTDQTEDRDPDDLLDLIKQAKEIIKLSKMDRLSRIDEIIKSQTPSTALLDATVKVLRAVLVSSSKSGKQIDYEKLMKKIDYINEARENLNLNLSEKLVLTNLFYKL